MRSSTNTTRATAPTATKAPPTSSHQVRSAPNARRQLPDPPQTMRGTISDITKMAARVLAAVQR